jgi:sigma-B regulation protein RsbU (phosphoserine phosphatase)
MTPGISPALRQALRADALPVVFGVLNLGAALVCAALALARRRRDISLLAFAACGALYGTRLLLSTTAARALFGLDPRLAGYLIAAVTYSILVPLVLFLVPLVSPRWRPVLRRLWQLDLAFGVAAFSADLVRRSPGSLGAVSSLWVLGNLLAIVLALALPGEPATWELRRLRASFLLTGVFILGENLRGFGLLPWPEGIEPVGLIIFLAGLGSIAARRFFDGQTRLSAVEQELATARRIQTSILPRELPRLPGLDIAVRYVPAAEVAGDFYDFLPAPPAATAAPEDGGGPDSVDSGGGGSGDGVSGSGGSGRGGSGGGVGTGGRRLGALVADASGHGVPAALIASMVKVAAAAQAAQAASPARVLSAMSGIFFGRLRGQFVTCAYVFLDLDAARLTWSNAGHPPPLLLHEGEVRELGATGTVLGRLSRAAHREGTLPLAPGDRLLLFTDGLPEAASPEGEPFGEERVRAFLAAHAALPAEAFAAALVARLTAWTGGPTRTGAGGGFADDLTLLVLQVQAPEDILAGG